MHRPKPTLNLAGSAGHGYCASHSRYFWGLRLHLVCTPTGLPVTYALTNPKVDERDVAIDLFDAEPALLADRHGQTIIADKGYASAEFERRLADHRCTPVDDHPADNHGPRPDDNYDAVTTGRDASCGRRPPAPNSSGRLCLPLET